MAKGTRKTGQGRPALGKHRERSPAVGNGSAAGDRDPVHIHPELRHLATPLDSLTPDPINARLHDSRNIESIARSLQHYGQRTPIVVRREGRIILKGNGTAEAARSLGWTQIAAVFVDDDDATAAGYAIADNRTAELATWDVDQLDRTLSEFDLSAVDVGFSGEDLEALRESIADALEETAPEEDAPPPPFQPVSGDVQPRLDQRAKITCPACGHEF